MGGFLTCGEMDEIHSWGTWWLIGRGGRGERGEMGEKEMGDFGLDVKICIEKEMYEERRGEE